MTKRLCRIEGIKPTDELSRFAKWFMEQRPIWMTPPGGVSFIDGVHGAVLYREGDKQVQLFICAPGTEIPDHCHPNVDSYEVAMWGMEFRHRGHVLMPFSKQEDWPFQRNGYVIRVLPSDRHGATAGPDGGCFLSIQHWRNGIQPTSVAEDWDGDQPLGEIHARQLAARQ